jgi:hypothetical protein
MHRLDSNMKLESERICAAENREKYCRRSAHDKGEEGEQDMSEGKERRYGLLSGRGAGYERMYSADYKRHGNGIIAQDAGVASSGTK